MAKVDLELVKLIMTRHDVDVRVMSDVINELKQELEIQNSEEKPPPVKKQFVMLLSDPEGKLEGQEFTGWVLQIPEEDSPGLVTEKIIKGAYDYNASPKGSRMPVESIGEACEIVTPKFYKEHQVWVKTKEPLWVVTTNNVIPKDNLSPLG